MYFHDRPANWPIVPPPPKYTHTHTPQPKQPPPHHHTHANETGKQAKEKANCITNILTQWDIVAVIHTYTMGYCSIYPHPTQSRVIRSCVSVDKYTVFPANTTIHFYCNTATCFGPLQNHHQASSKNFFKCETCIKSVPVICIYEITKCTKQITSVPGHFVC